ncbi:Hypothetical predicted protein [Xyrichtys novacula]|uniref:Uncharacterized protein n=1 Tax=Xyrichtys novacula TaxID=13765 RepID=A0AAV1FPK2_XYRNO|nr:Hypothetical predicted protein [Xyrichtys novacula]
MEVEGPASAGVGAQRSQTHKQRGTAGILVLQSGLQSRWGSCLHTTPAATFGNLCTVCTSNTLLRDALSDLHDHEELRERHGGL